LQGLVSAAGAARESAAESEVHESNTIAAQWGEGATHEVRGGEHEGSAVHGGAWQSAACGVRGTSAARRSLSNEARSALELERGAARSERGHECGAEQRKALGNKRGRRKRRAERCGAEHKRGAEHGRMAQ
jgi:hypothetical protein